MDVVIPQVNLYSLKLKKKKTLGKVRNGKVKVKGFHSFSLNVLQFLIKCQKVMPLSIAVRHSFFIRKSRF